MGVIQVSSQEQVIGPDARWVVTAMQNEQAVRDRAISNNPGGSVSMAMPIDCASLSKEPVALPVPGGSPDPTASRLRDFRPKALCPWLLGSAFMAALRAAKEPISVLEV
jgi:hypothetical protein